MADEIVQERWGGPGRHRSLPGQILAQDLDPAILVDAAITRGGREARVIAADWSALPEEALLGREMVDVVKRAIEERPVAHRRVIAMRDIAGLGADGVCEALGLSAADQRVLLHRARSRVRAPLEVHRDG